MGEDDRRLFVYGTLLEGEKDHHLLAGRTPIARVTTEAFFHLVDLGAYPALVPGGTTSVAGELYLVDLPTLLAIDVAEQVPSLFARARVRLSDGTEAESHVMDEDRVRGRRRLHHGDWRKRFTGHVAPITSPFARWARNRSR
jgi:gamma-glutamylaminecyclotransferase